ncbi:SseB family protein [Phytoactinopolyspora mesophila]|uniref:SseB family protein n=1 Tax=Phytoactinopolyspora mesophila TaxID=2650750 RepID=A0A7K3M226_9ACTN|nr:SseB family protein [Phytoactinopolyspora mesophila]
MISETGKTVPPSSFPGDDGSADPSLAAALSAYESGEGGPADVLAALAGGRVLVPVVASADEMGDDVAVPTGAVRGEKSSSMATVSMIGRDGRRGLLVFTSLESLHRWNPDARPVPVPTRAAAEAALADGADALVIDVAGPVLFSVDATGLRALASGWRSVAAWGGD